MKITRKKGAKKIKIEHNKKLFVAIVILLIFLGSVIWIIIKDMNQVDEIITEDLCVVDEDCVPASCCHPDSCVIKEKAPDCSDAFCTAVCSGPLDCGAGSCGCVENKCEVISNG
jgi:hypothetical protein